MKQYLRLADKHYIKTNTENHYSLFILKRACSNAQLRCRRYQTYRDIVTRRGIYYPYYSADEGVR